MLKRRLQETFPDREIEVVNVAMTAVSTYVLRDQAAEVIAQHPDLVAIYTGHNEYYGILGAASGNGVLHRGTFARALLSLRRLRLAQLLGSGLAAPAGRSDARTARSAMQHMAADRRVVLGSAAYERGLSQFRDNLGALLSRYEAHGIPVLIGTLASNERDQPPLDYEAGGDSARTLYALARHLDDAGDASGARRAYRAAKENDPLRFRAPEAVNQIIRDEAARHGAVVVETQRALEEASPTGVVGNSLMLEHLHPNLDGYFLIADAFYEAMRQHHLIGDWSGFVASNRARARVAITPVDSMVAILRTDRLVSGWPFRGAGSERTAIVDTLHPRSDAEQLARDVVLGRLPWPEATERLRERAERAGDLETAARAAQAMAEEYSYSAEPLVDLARLALRRGDETGAIQLARGALSRQPSPRADELLGLLLLKRGEQRDAMVHLQRAAEALPDDRRTVARFRAAGALPDLEARRAAAPRDSGALYNIAIAYALTDQGAQARAALEVLRRVAPAHAGARELLTHLPP